MTQSYEAILGRMVEKYKEITGNTPHKESDIYIRLQVLAGEIYNVQINMDWIKRQMLCDSAEGEWLDYHASLRGLERHSDAYSTGVCVFTCDTAPLQDAVIPKGTLVATKGDEELCFETAEEGVIFANTTAAHIPVKAIYKGRKYNVAAESITRFITPVASVSKVRNPDPTEGGTDTESDESLRNRIRESLKFTSNGTNCAYYVNTALEVEGVASAKVVPKGRGAGTVDVYVAAQSAEVSDETLDNVQNYLSEKREVNVDVKVMKATPLTVNLNLKIAVCEGYDFQEVSERIRKAVGDYISLCSVGSKVLLTEIGERVYHTEGVKEYAFTGYYNRDIKCEPWQFPRLGSITFEEGSVV